MPDGRVLVAFDTDDPLEPSPTWTRLDDTDNLIAGFDISRGRQTLADQTDTGTASVYVNDRHGRFDPNNASSPYFGELDGKQIMLQCWDPVNEEWVPQYRGTIDGYGYDINPATDQNGDLLIADVQINCVDIFEFLAGYGLTPGLDGKTPPAGSEGTICYYGGVDPLAVQAVDDRIIEVLADVGVDPAMYVVFSGNVTLQPTNYDADESALVVLRDACEAELPQIANMYCDKLGRFVFHGRISRFDPAAVIAENPGAWDFHDLYLGDGKQIAADSQYGQMRVLAYTQSRRNVINAVLCSPKGILETDIPGQVYADPTSIAAYGKRSLTIGDLVIAEGVATGNDANTECQKYGELLVKNQKDPRVTVDLLTVKAISPDDHRAAATWRALVLADISDRLFLKVGYPGGEGIHSPSDEDAGEAYYIESVTQRVRPLIGSGHSGWFDYVETDLGVSPATWSRDDHGVFD